MQRIYIVGQDHVMDMYPTVEPWLRKMAKWTDGRRNEEDIVKRLLTGQANLWITLDALGKPNGALVSTIEVYPRMRMLHVLHCAGEKNQMDGVADQMYDALDKFAQYNHCSGIEFVGRLGWKKHVEPRGYKSKAVIYERRFSEVTQ